MAERVVYSDIDIDKETYQTDGDWPRDINTNAIKNSIRNIIQTSPGSRRMLPTFASDYNNMLFEPMDNITAKQLGESLFKAIETWDNRVGITRLDVKTFPEDHKYEVDIEYYILPSTVAKTVTFTINTLG